MTLAAPVPPRRGAAWSLLRLGRDGWLADRHQLERLLVQAPTATDCFVFCPGGLEDEDETRRVATRFFALLEAALLPLRERVVPLLVALHWPSRPVALARASRALLAQLCDAEVPAGPEEDAELDTLRRSLRKPEALAFWLTKRHAAQVGERVGRDHLGALTEKVSTHLVGHAFGATLAASAVLGGARPASLTLLLAPLSAFAFAREVPGSARPGLYHRILAEGRVKGRIVVLHARHDRAPAGRSSMAARASASATVGERAPRLGRAGRAQDVVATTALGTAGARGVGAPDLTLLEVQRVGLPQHAVVNVDGSDVIEAREPEAGTPREVFRREVATLVLLAAGLLEGGPDGLRPARITPLATT